MILAYHEIVLEESSYLYSTTCRRLAEHLSFLAGLDSHVAITFDDGHASHFYHAPELMARYPSRGTFFVTAGWMDSLAGYMSWGQVRALLAAGHSIQSHGWSHKMLTQCGDAELSEELRRSKAVLEDQLGSAVESLAFPGGAWNDRVLRACADAGYRRVYTSDPWSGCRQANGVQIIGRLSVRRTMTTEALQGLLRAEHLPFSLLRLNYAMRKALRKTLGERLYHVLWCALANESERGEIARTYVGHSR